MSRSFIDILRNTLAQMEQRTDYLPNDPAMQKLRMQINEVILNSETSNRVAEAETGESPASTPIPPKIKQRKPTA
jgi:hypothetical protein